MGGYNSTPKTEKTSSDESHEHLDFGVSGMQGWRMTMEDAHCCVTDIDGKGTSLFAVFDGHGGSEVAEYCALNFDKFLLDAEAYEEGNFEKSLKDTFMAIDEAITSPEVIAELKELCGFEEADENTVDENAMLLEEANMPIEELLERIKENTKDKLAEMGLLKRDKEIDDKEIEEGEEKPVEDEKKPLQNGHTEEKQEVKSGKRKQKKPSKRVLDEQDNKNTSNETSTDEKENSSEKNSSGGSSLGAASSGAAGSSSGEPSSADGESLIDSSSGGSTKFSLVDQNKTENDKKKTESEDEDGEIDYEDDDSEDNESDYDDDDEESGDEEDEFEDGQGFDFVQDTGYDVGYNSGTTAIVALLRENKLYVGNVGDSRCVLCRDKKAFDMSIDHTPQDEKEKERVEAAGGKITADGRVNGGLNLTRAIGDHAFKINKDIPMKAQMISAYPDVKETTITKDDDFMVLACDGIWNVMSSEEVVQFIRSRLVNDENTDKDVKLSKICEELFDQCMAPDTNNDGAGCDNMTCMIVRFKHDEQGNLRVNGQTKRTRPANDNSPSSSEKSKKAKLTQ